MTTKPKFQPIFKCDMLALALLRIEIFLLLPSFSIETKSWQKHQSLSDSNNLADFNNGNKEFLPKKSSPKKILPKKSPQKNPLKTPSKKFLPKIFRQKNFLPKIPSEKFPKKFKKISKKSPKIQKHFKQVSKKFLKNF